MQDIVLAFGWVVHAVQIYSSQLARCWLTGVGYTLPAPWTNSER